MFAMTHTVEKIGGTSMRDYAAVRDNIILHSGLDQLQYKRIFVVSAYAGITDMLLEHKKSGQPGVYAFFANAKDDRAWREAMTAVREYMLAINAELFGKTELGKAADQFIGGRLEETVQCLADLQRLCQHGHFELESHLLTVREMLASLGEAHSAWNMAHLLQRDNINARFVDLSGWDSKSALSLDAQIEKSLVGVDWSQELPIVTGYAHCNEGLMNSFDRGYSEMTFSRIAVLTRASEAIIHKEFHLSSADPKIVGTENAVPIGRTNYDVADQLANLGMEAIHPRAAKGLRQNNIALRVKNTFDPEHQGTLITGEYISQTPCVEIIAGMRQVYSIEVFDQEMMGQIGEYDRALVEILHRYDVRIISKDINANTISHYLGGNLSNIEKIVGEIEVYFPTAEVNMRKVSIVSAIGSDMQVPGMLAKTVAAMADENINVLAMHQSMRQVDMQFVIDSEHYELAIQSLHRCLVEIHNHGVAICAG